MKPNVLIGQQLLCVGCLVLAIVATLSGPQKRIAKTVDLLKKNQQALIGYLQSRPFADSYDSESAKLDFEAELQTLQYGVSDFETRLTDLEFKVAAPRYGLEAKVEDFQAILETLESDVWQIKWRLRQ